MEQAVFNAAIETDLRLAINDGLDKLVLDATAASGVSLAKFGADSGTTNRSNVRMELNAVFGTERQKAAVRIAAS